MTTYVKYNESDNGSDFVYGYINGYLTDKDGNHLAVIVTRENKIITRILNKLITEWEPLIKINLLRITAMGI